MAKVITLTDAQALTLSTYILITTHYRTREIEASARLALETHHLVFMGLLSSPSMFFVGS